MSLFLRIFSRAWIIALIVAGGFLVWLNLVRERRVEYISGLVGAEVVVDAASPTGYAGGLRHLIVPEHNNDSYQWIAQTQQMLARGEWRIRHVDYDNAPLGREVRTPSPYRWWLGLVAWLDHTVSGRPVGLSVERAALFADPALQLLLLAGAVIFTAWHFGTYPAALLCVALVTIFPFGGAFLPGQPNDGGMIHACILWSVLSLLAGINPLPITTLQPGDPVRSGRRTQRLFFFAGLAGGIGLWLSAAKLVPLLAGIAGGAIMAAFLGRRATTADTTEDPDRAPWRVWALGGAVTSLAAYLIEYFPGHAGGLRLEYVHPLYGLAWLGTGELLARFTAWARGEKPAWNRREFAIVALAALAVAVVPALLLHTDGDGGLANDALSTRLTNLPDSPVVQNVWTWIYRDGVTAMIAATCLPALLLVPAAWLLVRRGTEPAHRAVISLALGPVLVALALAFFRLSWWSVFDAALLTLFVAMATVIWRAFNSSPGRWLYAGSFVLCLVPGLVLWVAQARQGAREAVTASDVEALIERDLAYWLANQAGAGGAIVLAPPNLTTSLYFHGGLAGLGTPYWENKDGFMAAIRIAGATSPDEAQAVARGRSLNYIVVPSWDPFLDDYARLGSNEVDHSLIALLHRWQPPRWLRPVPYHLPQAAGFEGQSVAIFRVGEVQDNALALSCLAEYFVEMGQIDQAVAASQALKRFFPADLGAAVARTLVERASGDTAAFEAASSELLPFLSRGDDRVLPWDRRVSLAIALVEGKRFDLAREQVQRCLAELDEPRLRSLTPASLYRVQVMSKAFGFGLPDQRLRELAVRLLPAELRNGL